MAQVLNNCFNDMTINRLLIMSKVPLGNSVSNHNIQLYSHREKDPISLPTRFTQTFHLRKILHHLKWQRSVFQHVQRHMRDKWIVILPNKNEIDQIYTEP